MGIAIPSRQANFLPPPYPAPNQIMSDPESAGKAKSLRKTTGRPYKHVTDAHSMSLLGAGMIVGAVIGAGLALLVAPDSGYGTRRRISSRVDRIRGSTGAWKRLGRELQRAARLNRKQVEINAKREELAAREGHETIVPEIGAV